MLLCSGAAYKKAAIFKVTTPKVPSAHFIGFEPGRIDSVIDNDASQSPLFQVSRKNRKLVQKHSTLVNGDG